MLNEKVIIHNFKYFNYNISIETGEIARNSNSSVLIKMNDTVILVTIVLKENKNTFNCLENNLFSPLIVNYQEKFYSSGKFPGGFFKREIKPTENEILISRLIDRSIRPILNNNYNYEINITITVLSLDKNISTDIVSIIGVSSALSISGISNKFPIGVSKIGFINNKFIINPNINDSKNSELNLILCGTKDNVLMIDCESNLLNESIIIKSIQIAFENQKNIIEEINKFKEKFYKENKKIYFNLEKEFDNNIYETILNNYESKFIDIYKIYKKKERNENLLKLKKEIIENIINIIPYELNSFDIIYSLNLIEKKIIRNMILSNNLRLDGRKFLDIRNIYSKVGILPRTHGSSLFTRGETQALVIVTLGNDKNAQLIENIYEEYLDKFIFHYNFPNYAVGEIGLNSFPKRREIGHGKLAKKSLIPIMPKYADFQYTIRVVSEITQSNGSSSMASVCGASLSLMDAGVPIKSHVAGIAMGLIKYNNNYVIFSDISGEEDNFGDADLKISGNYNGISALQMDMKIDNIELYIIEDMIYKSKNSRITILDSMYKTINSSKNISKFAPKIHSIKIEQDKIKNLIGKNGNVIKSIINETKSSIEVNDNGIVKIMSNNLKSLNDTLEKINKILFILEIGKNYIVNIFKITKNKLLVKFDINLNKIGAINILYYKNYNFKLNQKLEAKIINIDKYGNIFLKINKINNIYE